LNYGICGIGKYFAARLSNLNNADTEVSVLNRKHIGLIVEVLKYPYNTFFDILSVIHFLSDIYALNINQTKAKAYLSYAIDKLETIVYEEKHFGTYPCTFNPLSTAVTLIQASEKTGDKDIIDRANHFLNTYETDFRLYLDNGFQCFTNGSLKWSLLYHYLGKKLDNDMYKMLSSKWLNKFLRKDNMVLSRFCAEKYSNKSSTGILNGSAGIGLTLLTLTNNCSPDWTNLIPFYYESEMKHKFNCKNEF
jgi:hypothetical protein